MINNIIRRKELSYIRSKISEELDAAMLRHEATVKKGSSEGNENYQAGQVKAYRETLTHINHLIDLVDLDEKEEN